MSARLARLAFGSVARRTQTTSARVSRRAMSSTSHGAQAKSSDTPWIVGSTLVFLPAFLYLVSPSARKKEHVAHNDKRDYPALQHKDEPAPEPTPEPVKAEPTTVEPLADDEGNTADVSSSIAAAEGADVPKASQEPEENSETIAQAEGAKVDEQPSESSEQKETAPEAVPAKQEV